MLEQYLRLDQRSDSINYHCIMLWSSLVLIISANKFVASKNIVFIVFILMTKITGDCWWFLMINTDYFQKNLCYVCWHIFTSKLSIHYFMQISYHPLPTVEAKFKCLENSKLFPFWENFKLPTFIKEGIVSIMLFLFEELRLHVKLFIYTKNIFHKSCKCTNCPPNT